MDAERKMIRNFGILLACSTPVTGFVTFAFVAILFGEDRLEDASGTTTLGYLTLALPLVAGIALAAYAHSGGKLPSRTPLAIAIGVVGLACIGLGVASATNSDDASIGGGLLVLFGLASIVAAVALLLAARFAAKHTPPPPGPI